MMLALVRTLTRDQLELAAENLALRQQLAALRKRTRRPNLRQRDRIVWPWIARLWSNWRSVPVIVQPETVLRWHKQGFRLYWRWKSRPRKPAWPKIDAEIRKLIRSMSSENPTWGALRIRSELRLLGCQVSKATVDKYKVRPCKPPSQTWRTCLDNHVRNIVAVDFFTVPTATFRFLSCFIVLRHYRRMVAHFNVPAHPTAEWAAQQLIEAFPEDETLRFSIQDRDSIYADIFRQRVKNVGIEEVVIAPRLPWRRTWRHTISKRPT